MFSIEYVLNIECVLYHQVAFHKHYIKRNTTKSKSSEVSPSTALDDVKFCSSYIEEVTSPPLRLPLTVFFFVTVNADGSPGGHQYAGVNLRFGAARGWCLSLWGSAAGD